MNMAKKGKHSKIELSTPWITSEKGSGKTKCLNVWLHKDRENTDLFIKERTRLHELYVKEQEKTKRISLILAVVLIIVSVFLLIFAPKGKETLSYIVCGVLFIFAAGAVGYRRIWGKVPFVEFKADNLN
jgi:hypothetical protein